MMTFIGQEGKLLPSFHLALPSRSQTFSRIYLTSSSAFVRPCSMCYVCCCGGAAAAALRYWFSRGRCGREPAAAAVVSKALRPPPPPIGRDLSPLSSRTPNAEPIPTSKRANRRRRRKQSLRSIYRQSNARRQMARCSPHHLCHSQQQSRATQHILSLLRLAV